MKSLSTAVLGTLVVLQCVAWEVEYAVIDDSATGGADQVASEDPSSELRGVEAALAQKVHGNPPWLKEEEALLRKASGELSKVDSFASHSKDRRNKLEQLLSAHHKVSNTGLLQQSAGSASTVTSGAALFAGMAKTESKLARHGIAVVKEVDRIKEDVAEALEEQDPSKADEVEKLMDQVRHKEKTLMKQELSEAHRDRKQAANAKLLQQSTASTYTATSGTALLSGMANTESKLAREGVAVVKEVDRIKDDIVEALGDQNPSEAVQVEKLMDQVRHEQKSLMRQELSEAHRDRKQAVESAFVDRRPRKTFTLVQRKRQEAGSAEQQSMQAMASLVNTEASMATKEAHLAFDEAKIVKEIKHVKGAIADSLGATAPDVAGQVEKLMSLAEKKELGVAHNEINLAKSTWHKAQETSAEMHKQRPKLALSQRQQHRQYQKHTSSSKAMVDHMANLADSERRFAQEDFGILKQMKHIKGAIENALGDSDPEAAEKAERLMSLAQREQSNVAHNELRHAKRDWHLTIRAEQSRERQESMSHNRGTARQHSTFAQESSEESARSNAKFLAHFAKDAHAFKKTALRKQKLVTESSRILDEIKEARELVRDEFGGSQIGKEIGRLLKGAKVDAKHAVKDARVGAKLAKQDVRAAKEMMNIVRSEA